MAATMVLRSLPELLPTTAKPFLYVDDCLGLVGTLQEADELNNAFEQALGALPGRLRPKEVGIYDVRQGFDFLGFCFQFTTGGRVRVGISDQALSRLDDRCLARAMAGQSIEQLTAYVAHWHSAYHAADLEKADALWLARLPEEAWLLAQQTAA